MLDHVSTWLTRDEAAEYARVSVGTIDRWAREAKITKYSVAGTRSVRYKTSEIDAMMKPETIPA